MTDNVDFKAAKEWAEAHMEANVARAYLAVCELLGQAVVAVENASENADSRESTRKAWSELLERINAAIGE